MGTQKKGCLPRSTLPQKETAFPDIHRIFFLMPYTILQDHLDRTLLYTLAAVGAFLIIDHCQVILHMDGVKLALFCTKGTADTS